MTVSVSTVRDSQPDRLVEAADAMGRRYATLKTIAAGERETLSFLSGRWSGDAAQAALDAGLKDVAHQDRIAMRLGHLESALRNGGLQLGALRQGLLDLVASTERFGFSVADDGTVTPQQWLVGPLLDQIKRPIGTVLANGAYDGEPVYRAVAAHSPDAEVIIPPRSTAVPSDTAESAPSQRDRHIQRIAERGRLGWQRDVRYGRRSLGEVAMMRYKQEIGRGLRARSLPAQKIEAAVGCKVMNIMTSLGMPTTRKVA